MGEVSLAFHHRRREWVLEKDEAFLFLTGARAVWFCAQDQLPFHCTAWPLLHLWTFIGTVKQVVDMLYVLAS